MDDRRNTRTSGILLGLFLLPATAFAQASIAREW